MAEALDSLWDGPLEGVITVPDGYARPLRRLRVRTAGHPAPDARSVEAAEEAIALASALGPDDLLLALISGGGSALWCAPKGISLEDKAALAARLMAQGAPIAEINAARIKASRIKGGGLARAAHPARVETLAVSDVMGDDPALIASGPTHPGDRYTLIAKASDALAAARSRAGQAGLIVTDLGEIDGEAEAVARDHAARARRAADSGRPTLILSGGELTVVEQAGAGRGGPNTHYLLTLTMELGGHPGVWALAADTDGRDGASFGAGGLVGPQTLDFMKNKGIDPGAALSGQDSGAALEAIGALLPLADTGTNVSDLRMILVMPR